MWHGERERVAAVGADERHDLAGLRRRSGSRRRLGQRRRCHEQGAEQRLIETIRKVCAGETVIDEELLARARELARKSMEPDQFATLAPREREITEAVAMGLRNREIGERLGMTEGSVKVYLNRIFDKLGVENRTELAIRVHERKDGE